MPTGHLTIAADSSNAELAEKLRLRLTGSAGHGGRADVSISSSAPEAPARHAVVTGPLDDDVDRWDAEVAPQSVAAALWVPPGRDAEDVIVGWLALRLSMPAGPLSDLTDGNGRALRWSVCAATPLTLPSGREPTVDEQQVRSWLDEQQQVRALASAVDHLGGDNAEAVLEGVQRFREAVDALDELAELPAARPSTAFDDALADLLGHVQRRGMTRWRGGRARQASGETLVAAGRDVAGQRLREVIDALAAARSEQEAVQNEQELRSSTAESLQAAVSSLRLPVSVDFGRVPRTWSDGTPDPRTYVLISEDDAEVVGEVPGARVRAHEWIAPGTALCLLVQAGFSLPALR